MSTTKTPPTDIVDALRQEIAELVEHVEHVERFVDDDDPIAHDLVKLHGDLARAARRIAVGPIHSQPEPTVEDDQCSCTVTDRALDRACYVHSDR